MKRSCPFLPHPSQPKISPFFSSSLPESSDLQFTAPITSRSNSKLEQIVVPFGILNSSKNTAATSPSAPLSAATKLKHFISSTENEANDSTGGRESHYSALFDSKTLLKTKDVSNKIIKLLDVKNSNIKLTALEKQVVELKQENPDMLLLVESGYKYIMFGEDAEIAGHVLKMGTYFSHNLLNCSFPTHRVSIHIKRLVLQGYKVGVVEQTETAGQKAVSLAKHAPFKRAVKSVFTKSTFIDEPDSTSVGGFHLNMPLCLLFVFEAFSRSNGQVQIGTVALFTQENEVIYDHFEDSSWRTGLDDRFTHWQPNEVVLPSTGISPETLNFVRQYSKYKSDNGDCVRVEITPNPSADLASSLQLLSQFYEGKSEAIDMLAKIPPVVVRSLALTVAHLQRFNMDRSIRDIRNMKLFSDREHYLQMDGNTLRNLNLVNLIETSTASSLFQVLNKTRTQFGARLLRSWILKPLTSRKGIIERQATIEWLITRSNEPSVLEMKKILKSLPDLEKKLTLILHERLKPQDFHPLCLSWIQIRDCAFRLQFHYQNEMKPYLCSLLQVTCKSLSTIDTMMEQVDESMSKAGKKIRLFKDLSNYPEITELHHQIEDVLSKLEALKPSICTILGVFNFEYTTIGSIEYLIQVKNDQLGVVPSSWCKVSATKHCVRFRSPEVKVLYQKLVILQERLDEASNEAWKQFLRNISTSHWPIKQANSAIATLDVLLSLADVAQAENFVKPSLIDDGPNTINITQGWHPIIKRNMTSLWNQYVPNDTKLGGTAKRCMVINGPNMGGKSSYLSQVATFLIMAQMGSFVPADEAHLSIFESVFSRMGLHDDIYAGRSSFYVEMMETSSILQQSTSKSLVIIDELGRGTGTHDGSAIAFATLEHLLTQTRCITLFVTHYPILVQLADRYPESIANSHMGYFLEKSSTHIDSPDDDRLVFLYNLCEGACPQSFGINVARLAGIQTHILHKARAKSKFFQTLTENHRNPAIEEFLNLFG